MRTARTGNTSIGGIRKTTPSAIRPDRTWGGGVYDVYDESHEYSVSHVVHSFMSGGGTLIFRRLPAVGENPPAPYVYENEGSWNLQIDAVADAVAWGDGKAVRRHYSTPSLVPGALDGSQFMGWDGQGSVAEIPQSAAAWIDRVDAASYTRQSEDHAEGVLNLVISVLAEPDPDDAADVRYATQRSVSFENHVRGGLDYLELRAGHDRYYNNGGYEDVLPPYSTSFLISDTYDNDVDSMSEAWGFHPDGYLSHLFRGFAIAPNGGGCLTAAIRWGSMDLGLR